MVPPFAVRQSLPPFPGTLTREIQGMMEIVVGESGAVESADIRVATHPAYDKIAVAAARSWRYKPATRDGVAVRYRKLVQVTLKPTGQN